jgi:SPP1 gp7 family putative phage head morphogenesis protein
VTPWGVSADPVNPDDAIAWFRDRLRMTKSEFDALTSRARAQAFTVSGVAKVDVVHDVWKALDDAIANGTDLRAFKEAIGDTLTSAWKGSNIDPSFRLETIFRTNVQNAYSAGRLVAAEDPEVREARPYFLFDAVGDSRTSPACRLLNGVLLRADDPFWAAHTPPMHHRCRSQLITLSEDDALELGGMTAKPKVVTADGFGSPPHMSTWKPTLTDYPKALRPGVP